MFADMYPKESFGVVLADSVFEEILQEQTEPYPRTIDRFFLLTLKKTNEETIKHLDRNGETQIALNVYLVPVSV
jgi:hypothetical protein